MKELVEYIAKAITSQPEEVKVTQVDEGDRISLTLEVASDDKGRVIGRQGRVAQSMRTLIRVAAVKTGVRVSLEII